VRRTESAERTLDRFKNDYKVITRQYSVQKYVTHTQIRYSGVVSCATLRYYTRRCHGTAVTPYSHVIRHRTNHARGGGHVGLGEIRYVTYECYENLHPW